MDLIDEIKGIAGAEGMDFFGVADVSSARDAVAAQGGDVVARFPRAVSIGKTLIHAVVDGLSDPPEIRAAEFYRYYCYDLANDCLDKAALSISSALQVHGFAALPIPAAPRGVDHERLCGAFSSKLAAHLAGLGWIGRSCLLITPEVGPRARWASILTDAPLRPTGAPVLPRCGDCHACVDACPARAFTGRAFHADEGRESRFDAFACDRHLRSVEGRIGNRVCGICVKVCPHGVRASQNKPVEATA